MQQIPDQFRADQNHPLKLPGNLTPRELAENLDDGSRCVRYEYCITFVVASLRFQSRIHLTDTWESRILRGIPYSLMTLLLGFWGIPWGPVLTMRALWVNSRGGVDVTEEVEEWLTEHRDSGEGSNSTS